MFDLPAPIPPPEDPCLARRLQQLLAAIRALADHTSIPCHIDHPTAHTPTHHPQHHQIYTTPPHPRADDTFQPMDDHWPTTRHLPLDSIRRHPPILPNHPTTQLIPHPPSVPLPPPAACPCCGVLVSLYALTNATAFLLQLLSTLQHHPNLPAQHNPPSSLAFPHLAPHTDPHHQEETTSSNDNAGNPYPDSSSSPHRPPQSNIPPPPPPPPPPNHSEPSLPPVPPPSRRFHANCRVADELGGLQARLSQAPTLHRHSSPATDGHAEAMRPDVVGTEADGAHDRTNDLDYALADPSSASCSRDLITPAMSVEGQPQDLPRNAALPPILRILSSATSIHTQGSLSQLSFAGTNPEANRLWADYIQILNLDHEADRPPPEGISNIRLAAGDLYNELPIQKCWDLGRQVGSGGFSRVYRATHVTGAPHRNKLPYAVNDVVHAAVKKVAKKQNGQPTKSMIYEVFINRVIGRTGENKRVAEVYEVFEDEKYVYMVMELLLGGELFHRICVSGRYTEKRAANLVLSMLEGLSFCHRINIIHRDVKPENFVFSGCSPDAAGELKLIDLGVAYWSQDPSAMCSTLCGTVKYLAPETLLRQPYGCAADMWSVGIIAYIMLVGYSPFDDEDQAEEIRKIKYQPPIWIEEDWKGLSSEARDFVSNLLEKDAHRRMTAPQALEHKWLQDSWYTASDDPLDNVKEGIRRICGHEMDMHIMQHSSLPARDGSEYVDGRTPKSGAQPSGESGSFSPWHSPWSAIPTSGARLHDRRHGDELPPDDCSEAFVDRDQSRPAPVVRRNCPNCHHDLEGSAAFGGCVCDKVSRAGGACFSTTNLPNIPKTIGDRGCPDGPLNVRLQNGCAVDSFAVQRLGISHGGSSGADNCSVNGGDTLHANFKRSPYLRTNESNALSKPKNSDDSVRLLSSDYAEQLNRQSCYDSFDRSEPTSLQGPSSYGSGKAGSARNALHMVLTSDQVPRQQSHDEELIYARCVKPGSTFSEDGGSKCSSRLWQNFGADVNDPGSGPLELSEEHETGTYSLRFNFRSRQGLESCSQDILDDTYGSSKSLSLRWFRLQSLMEESRGGENSVRVRRGRRSGNSTKSRLRGVRAFNADPGTSGGYDGCDFSRPIDADSVRFGLNEVEGNDNRLHDTTSPAPAANARSSQMMKCFGMGGRDQLS